jgi:aryl-alcohol dehydrogenase-like predicted oxidoreductase
MPKKNDVRLGNTGLTVSRLSYGTAYMGSLGDKLSPSAGAALLLHAFKLGIYFWDTAVYYETHTHVAHALRQIDRNQVVISSKISLPAKPMGSVLEELDTDYLDILLVHEVALGEQDAARDALRTWQQHKAAGKVRALGLSTHSAEVATIAAEWPEVEVLMLPINSTGFCLPDQPIEGGIERMMAVAEKAHGLGKGIVAMKVMGMSTLAHDPGAAISFVACLPYVHSLCIGMCSLSEIEQNAKLLKLEE